MISETNPESGTTTYTYDSDSTCGTFKGDMVKKVDAAGNLTCNAYDQLHHLTSATVESGPYASVTPIKYFVYGPASGSVTVGGTAMVNAKGRLAEAYTCFSPCSAKITDEGFSYDARGELIEQWQSTPNSGGYKSTSAAFWPNGALQSLNDSFGYYLAFGVDGEGRPYSSTDGNGSHPLASTVYNAAGEPTQLNFGYTGDSDTYAYDGNTDRMTQYKFTVNGQSLIGNLTWNANGTLGSLLITDPFNSADTQSCSYTHDDLERLASVNCSGSGWSQNFAYDAFGNVTVTGSGQFQPGYNSSNQMLSPATYDPDGNANSDGQHTYTWDADGKPVTIDGVAITYDALGRIVEEDKSGTYTQIYYSPTGFKMQVITAGASVAEYAPMPGGGASVWAASGFYYRHGDWLGSSRFASTQSRTVYYDVAYAPFGQPYNATGIADPDFTGKDQQTVAGVYDFPAREYNGLEGRWASPDPAGLAAVNPADPQTWNRYAYVRNSPLGMTDPMGLQQTDYQEPVPITVTTSFCISCYELDQELDQDWFSVMMDMSGPVNGLVPDPLPPITLSCNPYNLSGCVDGGGNMPTLPPGYGSPGPTPPTVKGTQPQTQQCTALRAAAAQVGQVLKQASEAFGLIAAGSGLATALSGFGEAPSAGLDTGLTITAGSVTAFSVDAGFVTGAGAAVFSSFANGHSNALSAFDSSRLVGLAASLAASRLPFVGRFAETIGYAAEQASSIEVAQGVCQ